MTTMNNITNMITMTTMNIDHGENDAGDNEEIGGCKQGSWR